MAIAMIFTPPSMTRAQYDETIRRLEAAGQGAPSGRLHHVAFEGPGGLRVVDVWESQAAFEAFGRTMMPILQEIGIDPGQPDVGQVHKIISG
jgi:hypothetical protein